MAVTVSGEPLLSPGLFLRALVAGCEANLLSERVGGLFERLGGRAQLFEFGRQALTEGLRRLGVGQILVPAYICDTVIDGVNAAGWRWRHYPLGDRLAPDWDWLERNPQPSDSAILLVHYFGFPSDLEHALLFAERHRLALIEDCAHAFLTAVANPPVGRAGSMAIYSWRKFLPVANGGALVDLRGRNGAPGGARPGILGASRQLAKWAVFKSGSRFWLHRLGSILSDEPDWTRRPAATAGTSDWIAGKVLTAEEPYLDRISQRRRANYLTLFEGLDGRRNVKPLTAPDAERAVPWCLPMAVSDAAARHDLVQYLLGSGIGAWEWPTLPVSVSVDAFPRDFQLAARTVCLPVHQSLDRRHMRYMFKVLARW